MFKGPSPRCLALFVRLSLAHLNVPKLADIWAPLFAILAAFLLLLLLGLQHDTPLCPPVTPHMAELVCGEKWLAVFPVESIPPQNIISELCQNSCSSWIST